MVADGVGGHAHGDMAARMVVELLPQAVKRLIGEMSAPLSDDAQAVRDMLQKSVSEVSRRIYAQAKDSLENKGMGATVVVVLVTRHHAHIVHMGDSRAYMLRRERLRLLTADHSIVGLLERNGEITHRQASTHPARGRLTRFAGMEADADPASQTLKLQAGDRILLCTDGLWGMLPQADVKRILAERNDPDITCRDLVAAGKAAGGRDNLTTVVADVVMSSAVGEKGALMNTYTIRKTKDKVIVEYDGKPIEVVPMLRDTVPPFDYGIHSDSSLNLGYGILRHCVGEAEAQLLCGKFVNDYLLRADPEIRITGDEIHGFVDSNACSEYEAQELVK
ncbi:MAG: protein phosphatase 2C domain-containing protein, partial [Bacteroidota bacterium]